jgi:hypothetical protein
MEVLLVSGAILADSDIHKLGDWKVNVKINGSRQATVLSIFSQPVARVVLSLCYRKVFRDRPGSKGR